jgi:hypothetical protein
LLSGCEETPEPEWYRLVDGDWSLAPGTEATRWCKKVVIPEEMWATAIRPIDPPGTHHTTLSLRPDDGKSGCEMGTLGPDLIYASGAGTKALMLPEGVAFKLPAGYALFLGLHVYNATTAPLAGTSGIEILRTAKENVVHEADMLLAGPLGFSIQPGRSTITHECTLGADQTAFAIFPHMHQMGVHLKTTAMVSGSPLVIHDGEYKFQEQYQLPIPPVVLKQGDKIATECTYQNDTGKPVSFGESSDTEMCFSVLFRYPATGSKFCGMRSSNPDGGSMLPNHPCAAMSDPGNELGVGRYCTKNGGECGGANASLCLADFLSGEFANFCTKLCSTDMDCGSGATCSGSGSQKACIPTKCQM